MGRETRPMAENGEQKVMSLARKRRIIRPRDLTERGMSRASLQRLVEKGLIRKTGRGLYELADLEPTEHHTLAEAAKRVPRGVICLLSALEFHGLTTQLPPEVWMAIDRKARAPRVDYPPIRVVRFSGAALSEGLDERRIEGVPVRIYGPAKTVADCFKYRNKIGLDVALEGLRECWRRKRATMDELWRLAGVCRVANVMRPYMESLT